MIGKIKDLVLAEAGEINGTLVIKHQDYKLNVVHCIVGVEPDNGVLYDVTYDKITDESKVVAYGTASSEE